MRTPRPRVLTAGTAVVTLVLGVLVGFLAAAPVGPVNLLVIRLAAIGGFPTALAAGAASTLADAVFAGAAIFGVGWVSEFMQTHRTLVHLAGGLLMLGFGIGVLVSHPHLSAAAAPSREARLAAVVSAFAMTITNPAAIIGFAAMVGGLGRFAPTPEDPLGAGVMLAGVVLGSLGWWTALSALVVRFRHRIGDRVLERVNRAIGAVIVFIGVLVLADLALLHLG